VKRVSKRFVSLLFSFIALIFLLNVNCQNKGIDTAMKLSEALKKEGINYQTIEEVEIKLKYAKIDEEIALKGDDLWLQMFRIEDERSYKTSVTALMFRLAMEKEIENEQADKVKDIFIKKPFIVMIMQEPADGVVRQALNKIFPKPEE
jgi:hypothetical protein